MMLATGATGVKQARYRRRPTRGSEALARAFAVYTHNASVMYVRNVRPAYEFRRGFCTSFLQLECIKCRFQFLSVPFCLPVPFSIRSLFPFTGGHAPKTKFHSHTSQYCT